MVLNLRFLAILISFFSPLFASFASFFFSLFFVPRLYSKTASSRSIHDYISHERQIERLDASLFLFFLFFEMVSLSFLWFGTTIRQTHISSPEPPENAEKEKKIYMRKSPTRMNHDSDMDVYVRGTDEKINFEQKERNREVS